MTFAFDLRPMVTSSQSGRFQPYRSVIVTTATEALEPMPLLRARSLSNDDEMLTEWTQIIRITMIPTQYQSGLPLSLLEAALMPLLKPVNRATKEVNPEPRLGMASRVKVFRHLKSDWGVTEVLKHPK